MAAESQTTTFIPLTYGTTDKKSYASRATRKALLTQAQRFQFSDDTTLQDFGRAAMYFWEVVSRNMRRYDENRWKCVGTIADLVASVDPDDGDDPYLLYVIGQLYLIDGNPTPEDFQTARLNFLSARAAQPTETRFMLALRDIYNRKQFPERTAEHLLLAQAWELLAYICNPSINTFSDRIQKEFIEHSKNTIHETHSPALTLSQFLQDKWEKLKNEWETLEKELGNISTSLPTARSVHSELASLSKIITSRLEVLEENLNTFISIKADLKTFVKTGELPANLKEQEATALPWAIEKGYIQLAEQLVEAGVGLNTIEEISSILKLAQEKNRLWVASAIRQRNCRLKIQLEEVIAAPALPIQKSAKAVDTFSRYSSTSSTRLSFFASASSPASLPSRSSIGPSSISGSANAPDSANTPVSANTSDLASILDSASEPVSASTPDSASAPDSASTPDSASAPVPASTPGSSSPQRRALSEENNLASSSFFNEGGASMRRPSRLSNDEPEPRGPFDFLCSGFGPTHSRATPPSYPAPKDDIESSSPPPAPKRGGCFIS
jgi:hypothetical protein